MQRRTLLRLGLGAGTALALAGWGAAAWAPGLSSDGSLSPASRLIFARLAPVLLEGNLPPGQPAALDAHLGRVQAAVQGLPPATRAELSDLLALLALPPGRLGLTGLQPAWAEASAPALQQALQGMRRSSLQVRRQVYLALRELTVAAYFSDPSAWGSLGYPGPRSL